MDKLSFVPEWLSPPNWESDRWDEHGAQYKSGPTVQPLPQEIVFYLLRISRILVRVRSLLSSTFMNLFLHQIVLLEALFFFFFFCILEILIWCFFYSMQSAGTFPPTIGTSYICIIVYFSVSMEATLLLPLRTRIISQLLWPCQKGSGSSLEARPVQIH